MKGYKFKHGDRVRCVETRWEGTEWIVEKECELLTEEGGLRCNKYPAYMLMELHECPDGEYYLTKIVLPEYCLELIPAPGNKITAVEYAEKLKAVLGYEYCKNIDGADPEDEVCVGLGTCEECPFYHEKRKAVFGGSCEALMLYHPDLAVKLMDEWQEKKDKPRGKTYLEYIRERLPNVLINKFGIPDGCRKRLCNGIACTDCMPGMEECRKCWNEVMPEEDNAEG